MNVCAIMNVITMQRRRFGGNIPMNTSTIVDVITI